MQGILQGFEGVSRQLPFIIMILIGVSSSNARHTHAQGIDEDVKDYMIRRALLRAQRVLPGCSPGATAAHPSLYRHMFPKTPPPWRVC